MSALVQMIPSAGSKSHDKNNNLNTIGHYLKAKSMFLDCARADLGPGIDKSHLSVYSLIRKFIGWVFLFLDRGNSRETLGVSIINCDFMYLCDNDKVSSETESGSLIVSLTKEYEWYQWLYTEVKMKVWVPEW